MRTRNSKSMTAALTLAGILSTGVAFAADDVDEITMQVVEEGEADSITQQIELPAQLRERNREQERQRVEQAESESALREQRQEMHEQRQEVQQQRQIQQERREAVDEMQEIKDANGPGAPRS